MSDVLKFLRAYPNDTAAVMSKARVEEAIAEIERLRGESAVNRHIISCLREEIRLEREARQTDEEQIDKLTAERDALRAELAAEREAKQSAVDAAETYRDERDACIKEVAEAGKRQGQAEAECDALRAALELIADTDPDEGTAWFHSVANAALKGKDDDV